MLKLYTALAAALLPPLTIAWVWFGRWEPMPDAIVTAALHFAFLGLPALVAHFVLARLRWWSLMCTGGVCGLVPTAVWSWPLMMPGVPADEVWVGYSVAVAVMAGYGPIAGFGFWCAWVLWGLGKPFDVDRAGDKQGARCAQPGRAQPGRW